MPVKKEALSGSKHEVSVEDAKKELDKSDRLPRRTSLHWVTLYVNELTEPGGVNLFGDKSQAELDQEKAEAEKKYLNLIKEQKKLEDEAVEKRKLAAKSKQEELDKQTALNALQEQQKQLETQIAQNEKTRQQIGGVRDRELKRLQADLGQMAAASNQPSFVTGNTGDFSLTGQVGRDYAARHGGVGLPNNSNAPSKEDDPAKTSADLLKQIRDILDGDN